MRIAICDDEQLFIEKVDKYINAAAKKHGRESIVDAFDSGEELVKACRKHDYDAIFLDIAMPKINGFTVAKKLMEIKKDITLIFVSSKETLVYSSYEYKPFWFVPKSQLSLLETVTKKIIQKIETEEIESRLVAVRVERNRIYHLNLKETAYIKSDGHYLNIFSTMGNKSESYRYNLNSVEKQLTEYGFIRCHERFIVNSRMISSIESTECILLNGEKVPISRRKMAETRKAFQKYLRGIM